RAPSLLGTQFIARFAVPIVIYTAPKLTDALHRRSLRIRFFQFQPEPRARDGTDGHECEQRPQAELIPAALERGGGFRGCRHDLGCCWPHFGSNTAKSGCGRGITSASISLPPRRSTVALPVATADCTAATSPRIMIVTYAAPIFSLPTSVTAALFSISS